MTTRRKFTLMLLASGLTTASSTISASQINPSDESSTDLLFDASRFVEKKYAFNGETIHVRAFEGLPTVTKPVEPAYQAVNVYIPEAYFHGKKVGSYDAKSAPIFFPNKIGGYMPAKPAQPDESSGPPLQSGQVRPPSAMIAALARGFVVVSPGARGRSLRSSDGIWTGKAPSAILDLKAAVRWIRFNSKRMPGNVERIISNGTSAGGALSALLAASGNNPDYIEALTKMGAAATNDNIFAASAYCPITNLEHADAAYEWQFHGIEEYRNISISMLDFKVQRKEVLNRLTPTQLTLSNKLRTQFIEYVNQLGLHTPHGQRLSLDNYGRGGLLDYIKVLLIESAQLAMSREEDVSKNQWLTISDGRVADIDFNNYVRAIGRMKGLPAFDGLMLETGENQLFGDSNQDLRHFTDFSLKYSNVPSASKADDRDIRLMNAMSQVTDMRSVPAKYWRIRHGSRDKDTSLAIPALLASAARSRGLEVDLALPWDRSHSGDYDLDELFAWIEQRVS